MSKLISRTKKTIIGISVLSILAFATGLLSFSKATVDTISIHGKNITSNTAGTAAVLGSINEPVQIEFKTGVDLKTDGNTLKIELNGISVSPEQTLTLSDLTFSGCESSNTLEAAPGTNNNGAHEVTIINGSAGDLNPQILISLDTDDNTLNCKAGETYKLTIDSTVPQLTSSATAGNYLVAVSTSHEAGTQLFYVGNEGQTMLGNRGNQPL